MTQTLQQRLRAARNKVIPPKLELGCEVKRFENTAPEYYCGNHGGIPRLVRRGDFDDFYDDGSFTILGKPTSLTDLMRMLKGRKIQLQANGVLQEVSGETYETETQTIICNIDLTRGDNIELQAPEVLEKLLSIIE